MAVTWGRGGWMALGLAGVLAGEAGCTRGNPAFEDSGGDSDSETDAASSASLTSGVSNVDTNSDTFTSTTTPSDSGELTGDPSASGTTDFPNPECGNGIKEPPEECDWADPSDAGRCHMNCKKNRCGDGIKLEQEACDDGNENDGDGCSSTCQLEDAEPFCGDGEVQNNEQCEAGVTVPPACAEFGQESGLVHCDNTCQWNADGCFTCGDDEVHPELEECEPGIMQDISCESINGEGDGYISCINCQLQAQGDCCAPQGAACPFESENLCCDGLTCQQGFCSA